MTTEPLATVAEKPRDSGHISGFYRSGTGETVKVESEDDGLIQRALADADGVLWIDLVTTDLGKARILDEVFHFHPLTIEDTVSTRVDPAKIDDMRDYIFVVVQAITTYTPGEELETVEVDFYLGKNYIVSCHREPVPAIETFRQRCYRDEHTLGHTSDWLLHGILDALVDEYLPIVDELDETIDVLEEQVLDDGDRKLLMGILIAKRNTLRLRRATTPQRDIMNRLARNEFPELIRPETSIYFRDIYDHLVRTEYLVEALRDLADGALQTYLSVVSNRLNSIMKVLTAAATLFLPLTVITGVYGMNFESNQFPPFDSSWGFSAVIAAMAVNSILMLVYFRYRRWI